MFTGRAPFLANAKYEVIRQVLETEPARPRTLNRKVDVDLETIAEVFGKRTGAALSLRARVSRRLGTLAAKRARAGAAQRNCHAWAKVAAAQSDNGGTCLLVRHRRTCAWSDDSEMQPVRLPNGIAVLPFENLSDANESASLADGIQDDILTNWPKSRT